MYGEINTDKRFVVPNRGKRIGERADTVRSKINTLRAQFSDRPLVLTTPGSVNWITGGLSDPVDVTASTDPVWAIDSTKGRALITSEIEAPRLRGDFDLDALGWNLVAVPWYDASAPLLAASAFSGVSPEELLSDTDTFGLNVTTTYRSYAPGTERSRARGTAPIGRGRGRRTRGRC